MAGFGVRKGQRLKTFATVQYRGDGIAGEGIIKDLSLSGGYIIGNTPVSVGMALALKIFVPGDPAELLLIDESAGRRVARRLLIPHTGVLGVLAAAKHRGLISAVAPLFEKLRGTGFWISDDLMARVLKDLGEVSSGRST